MAERSGGSAACLSRAVETDDFRRESFHEFFERWLEEQQEYLDGLVTASERYRGRAADGGDGEGGTTPEYVDESGLREIIKSVVEHYELYHRAKSTWSKHGASAMFCPTWRSSFEDGCAWMGEWRPSMSINLLYSKSGLQSEARLTELARGLTTRDLGDLSAGQLARVDELHLSVIRRERQISEMMATLQESVAAPDMVELSHAATEVMRRAGESGEGSSRGMEGRIEEALTSKEAGMAAMLKMGDDLRLTTLKRILDILKPIQAVHFLIAVAELHLRLHDWGKQREGTKEEEEE